MRLNGISERLLRSLVERKPARPMGELHPQQHLDKLERMRRKAQRVAEFLEERRYLLPLQNPVERKHRLIDRDYVLSAAHQEQGWAVDRRGQDVRLLAFEERFLRDACRIGIPLYCCLMEGLRLEMIHAQYEHWLGARDWEIIALIGHEAARNCVWKGMIDGQYKEGVGVRVVYDPRLPMHWTLNLGTPEPPTVGEN